MLTERVIVLRRRAFCHQSVSNAIVLFIIPYLMGPAVQITGVAPALFGCLHTGIVNALIRPILIVCLFPIQLLR